MAINMNRATPDHYVANSVLTLPNSDWCIATAVRITANTGSERQTIISCRAGQYVNVMLNHASFYLDPGKCTVEMLGAGNPEVKFASSTQVPIGSWLLGVLQRKSGTKELWVGSFGNVPTLQGSSAAALAGITPSGDNLRIGWRTDWVWAIHGAMAFMGVGDFALSNSELYALARGLAPLRVTSRWRKLLPMTGPSSTLREVIGGAVFTPTGSPSMAGSPFRSC